MQIFSWALWILEQRLVQRSSPEKSLYVCKQESYSSISIRVCWDADRKHSNMGCFSTPEHVLYCRGTYTRKTQSDGENTISFFLDRSTMPWYGLFLQIAECFISYLLLAFSFFVRPVNSMALIYEVISFVSRPSFPLFLLLFSFASSEAVQFTFPY